MRRSDVLKVLFVCVCVCHVCPAHPCGENPLRLVDSYSRNRGLEREHILLYMRDSTPIEYTRLMSLYRAYLECIQMVHTGYFKRSVDITDNNEAISTTHLRQSDDNKRFMDTFSETMKRISAPRQHKYNLEDNVFNSMSGSDTDSADAPLADMPDLPTTIKRLLHRKISASQFQRAVRISEETSTDV